MTGDDDSSQRPADKPGVLQEALEKNQDVKDKVESCAVELSTVNETARKEIAAGSTLAQVERTLARSESVEERVQECADDLHEVNMALKHEVDDRIKLNRELMKTGQELSVTQDILSNTQDVLAVAHKVRSNRGSCWHVPRKFIRNSAVISRKANLPKRDWVKKRNRCALL